MAYGYNYDPQHIARLISKDEWMNEYDHFKDVFPEFIPFELNLNNYEHQARFINLGIRHGWNNHLFFTMVKLKHDHRLK